METTKLHHMIKVRISGQQHGFMPGKSTDDDVCFENVDGEICRRSVTLCICESTKSI